MHLLGIFARGVAINATERQYMRHRGLRMRLRRCLFTPPHRPRDGPNMLWTTLKSMHEKDKNDVTAAIYCRREGVFGPLDARLGPDDRSNRRDDLLFSRRGMGLSKETWTGSLGAHGESGWERRPVEKRATYCECSRRGIPGYLRVD